MTTTKRRRPAVKGLLVCGVLFAAIAAALALGSNAYADEKPGSQAVLAALRPLRANDIPQDSFETIALGYAMNGQNYNDVQRVDDRWYYRRSVALSNFHTACALCHSNFGPVNSNQWVGA